jgi:hypothetical protein
MTPKLASFLILILLSLGLSAGCVSPAIPPDARSSGGTQAPPAGQPPGSGTVATPVPGPVVTEPEIYDIEIQVDKNMIFTNPDIRVRFSGGKGMYIIRRMFVQVFKSDGTYEQGQIEHPAGEFRMGETVTIRGTTGTDRVIVTITILGKDYKIYDQYLEFKTRP